MKTNSTRLETFLSSFLFRQIFAIFSLSAFIFSINVSLTLLVYLVLRQNALYIRAINKHSTLNSVKHKTIFT